MVDSTIDSTAAEEGFIGCVDYHVGLARTQLLGLDEMLCRREGKEEGAGERTDFELGDIAYLSQRQ